MNKYKYNDPNDRIYLLQLIAFVIGIVGLAGIAVWMCSCTTPQPAPPPQIIVQHDLAPQPKPVIPPDPWLNLRPDVFDAIKHSTGETLHDGITTIWPYSADEEWTIDCQPLKATEIILRSDEETDKDNVLLGDSTRWLVRVANQAVMVEPLGTNQTIVSAGPQPMVVPPDPGMRTNLVIHTTKRSYHLALRLHGRDFMGAVAWYYPDNVREEATLRKAAMEAGK